HGAGPGNVNGGTDADAGRDCAVEAGGEDVREHGQIHDLFQGLVAVREAQEVPVRVWNQDVLCLAAHPAAHVYVAVGAAGTGGVDARPVLELKRWVVGVDDFYDTGFLVGDCSVS